MRTWRSPPIVTLAAVVSAVTFMACGTTGGASTGAPRAKVDAKRELCVAAGTWAAATHYKEHLRRPDPLEAHNLAIAQSRANQAVASFRRINDTPGLALARRLAQSDERFRESYRTGVGLMSAEAQVVDVLDELPSSCVLASRVIGPS